MYEERLLLHDSVLNEPFLIVQIRGSFHQQLRSWLLISGSSPHLVCSNGLSGEIYLLRSFCINRYGATVSCIRFLVRSFIHYTVRSAFDSRSRALAPSTGVRVKIFDNYPGVGGVWRYNEDPKACTPMCESTSSMYTSSFFHACTGL